MVERDNELKGTTFTISVLHLSDGNPARIRQLLEAKVAQAPQFFNCAPLVLNVERLEAIPDFEQLRELVESEDFVLVGITGARDEAMKTAAKAAGLAVMVSGKSRKAEPEPTPPVPEPKPVEAAPVPPVPAPVEASKVHVGPVRSGQQIYAAGTSLVVLGSVSPGAEVIADDSIHVYGALRGRAIAGAKGNPKARIYCQQLQAELLSIAGTFQLSDALPAGVIQEPVHIRLDNEQLRIDRIK
ncbi:septum site-determining protein MinC [Aeromonas caviae]|jgi:septum site-determining protein MinC|uniref:Probable septum site-determining protein MinC n=1 Tax=Aeromonas caviae TaxID=648 RepID=A0A2X4NNK0_AERCA|nr:MULTISPECIES: septum site-determining protein MinC [Aeromonas]PZQ93643.1 MAG: septum site-determining protein MinC [Aeromonas media]TXH96277.1 MAG: septum site-determining protein MinC [Pseudorhodobacter sp.]AUT40844.1 septum site-determining protein MinC [Aeromonas sp. ASNIH5]AUV12533.1 septum site-determining protein MinC [Aeromonas sp. ASNIH3]AXB02579.1 septum site-determining protein MinC [Aeromonas caviae]